MRRRSQNASPRASGLRERRIAVHPLERNGHVTSASREWLSAQATIGSGTRGRPTSSKARGTRARTRGPRRSESRSAEHRPGCARPRWTRTASTAAEEIDERVPWRARAARFTPRHPEGTSARTHGGEDAQRGARQLIGPPSRWVVPCTTKSASTRPASARSRGSLDRTGLASAFRPPSASVEGRGARTSRGSVHNASALASAGYDGALRLALMLIVVAVLRGRSRSCACRRLRTRWTRPGDAARRVGAETRSRTTRRRSGSRRGPSDTGIDAGSDEVATRLGRRKSMRRGRVEADAADGERGVFATARANPRIGRLLRRLDANRDRARGDPHL